MGETTFETQWEWLNGKTASEVVRETQLKWLEAEDGALLRVDSVVAIYPTTVFSPMKIKVQVENMTYAFKTYSDDTPIQTMKEDINCIVSVINIGTWTSNTLKASDIGNKER